jgi:hypothetical protein
VVAGLHHFRPNVLVVFAEYNVINVNCLVPLRHCQAPNAARAAMGGAPSLQKLNFVGDQSNTNSAANP